MRLAFSAFQGEIPLLDPRLLPERNAQTARNVDLRRGTLRPAADVAAVSSITTVASPTTLYRYPNGNGGAGWWFTWAEDVEVVKSPLADDAWNRVYWTGDGIPKMGGIDLLTSGAEPYPSASYDLGVPAPATAPSVSAPGGRVSESNYPDTALETAYVVTLISGYGEESAPSDPSGTIIRWDMVSGAPAGGEVEVSLPAIPSGNHDIVTKRIYRVESGGVYQFVADVSAATSSYTDSVASEALGVALPSEGWDMPDPSLAGLTAMPGGFLAGFFGNTLAFSEAYRPHAWPVGYQLAFPDDIVAIVSTGSGLVVATTGQPHLVTGSSPVAMAPLELDARQPCLSARSLVDMGDYALYASPDGLVAVGGREAQVVTRNVLTRDQWQALGPETIHAYRYDGAYLAFTGSTCFRFTPGEGFAFFDVTADGGYYDIADDTLYLIQGTGLVAWDQGADLTYTWRSRVSEAPPGAASFNCAKVIAYSYPVTFRLYADGALLVEHSVTSPWLFRLPAAGLARDWEVELEGTAEVASVQVASSPSELV